MKIAFIIYILPYTNPCLMRYWMHLSCSTKKADLQLAQIHFFVAEHLHSLGWYKRALYKHIPCGNLISHVHLVFWDRPSNYSCQSNKCIVSAFREATFLNCGKLSRCADGFISCFTKHKPGFICIAVAIEKSLSCIE